jgi:cyclic beta-1,2-glucan synthetase
MYVVRRESASVAEDFRHAGKLRGSDDGEAHILPAARDLVRSGLGYVDGERTALFLEGFMKTHRLPEKELALFAAAIRLELLRYLLDSLHAKEGAERAAENVLRPVRLAATDLYRVVESVNPTEKILRNDPSGAYQRMDVQSRAVYRRELSRLAARYGLEEAQAAERVLELSRRAGGNEDYKRHVAIIYLRSRSEKGK